VEQLASEKHVLEWKFKLYLALLLAVQIHRGGQLEIFQKTIMLWYFILFLTLVPLEPKNKMRQ
jgi:hypothetical protein